MEFLSILVQALQHAACVFLFCFIGSFLLRICKGAFGFVHAQLTKRTAIAPPSPVITISNERTRRIVFRNRNQVPPHLKGLRDAFTGEPINVFQGLYQCTGCRVFYHQHSHEALSQSGSGCIACGSKGMNYVSQQQLLVSAPPGWSRSACH